MELNNIKCVIFDFDCTLYSNGDESREDEYFAKFFNENNIKYSSMEDVYKKYPSFHKMQATLAYARDMNFDDNLFFDYVDKNIFDVTSPNIQVINQELVYELAKYYDLYVLSDSNESYLDYYYKLFNIDKSVFKRSISNEYRREDMSKAPYMREILAFGKYKADEILMVGDSYEFDIIPANRVGIKSQMVNHVSDTEKLILDLIKLAKESN